MKSKESPDNFVPFNKRDYLPEKFGILFQQFYQSYLEALKENHKDTSNAAATFERYLNFIMEQMRNPFIFEPYHQRISEPFNYYRYGLDFLRPIVKMEQSRLEGLDKIDEITEYLSQGHNVILFANHQIEPDPQALSLLLEKTHPKLAEEIICVAGHRVVTDPLAVPFSKGLNLICIYSKNYIESPPEKKAEKLHHNYLAMKRTRQLLTEGGKCIWVAPSGGRDRPDIHGKVHVAHFHPDSIEMFRLMSTHVPKPVHFYPLALATNKLLPPPNKVQKELGEPRHPQASPIHMSVGPEIDMNHFPGSDVSDKYLKRKMLADYIWMQVRKMYENLTQ